MPPRRVHPDQIQGTPEGLRIQENCYDAEEGFEQDHYNHYGMIFRIKAPPGAYEIRVKTMSELKDTVVSISGMHGKRILGTGKWDSAGLVPIHYTAQAEGRNWFFNYANGREFIDIEVEPLEPGGWVGLQEVELTPIPVKEHPAGHSAVLFILGDSTAKSYTFDEAPMCGWGQVFDDLFDQSRIQIVNYSMGGRSFKNAYWEGRFNNILLRGCLGDYILIQFGHNDESLDEHRRYGRGNLESSYEAYIRDVYIPAIRARGMIPVLITPTSRINVEIGEGQAFTDSFTGRRFPAIMRRMAEELHVSLLDLTAVSVRYYNEDGREAVIAMFMAVEAGETPGKHNVGSYANGHPANKIDGTHYKEALARQLARLVAAEIVKGGSAGDTTLAEIASCLRPEVQKAIAAGDWSVVYPFQTKDTRSGRGAYYRNQIEKLLQLGVLHKDSEGLFHPETVMDSGEFAGALAKLLGISAGALAGFPAGPLTREVMAAVLYTAYGARFTEKPPYMTNYNGTAVLPGDPMYDPNLDADSRDAMYPPLTDYSKLTDLDMVSPRWHEQVKAAYELGLIRAEKGIVRGRMMNGTELEPQAPVTRAKAAKALYFIWVLSQPVKVENDKATLE